MHCIPELTVSEAVPRTLATPTRFFFGLMGNGNAWFVDALVYVVDAPPTGGLRPSGIDQDAIVRACGARPLTVGCDDAAPLAQEAMDLALAERIPVVLNIPHDLADRPVTAAARADVAAPAPARCIFPPGGQNYRDLGVCGGFAAAGERTTVLVTGDGGGLMGALGARASVVRTLAELGDSEEWIASGRVGAYVLDCRVSRSVVAPFLRGMAR